MLKTRNGRLGLALIVLITALFLTMAVVADLTPREANAANITETMTNGETLSLSGSPSGILTVPAGASVIIDGTVTATTTGITLDISGGSTVQWSANLQGASASYLVTVSGNGTLEIGSCTIANTGSGGTINIIGAGTTVTLGIGALLYSGSTNGNSILVTADNVTINLDQGSTVQNLGSNGNATMQVGSNVQGTKINVNGGSVISVGSGYAINDGAGVNTVSNNTEITVSAGTVTAGTACAIHSVGTGSVVTVSGGTVSNAAGNNINPAIYMNAGSIDNVIVSGGTVQSTSNAGYAIQSTGNVLVSDGLVTAVNGRAINLIGMDSVAKISGGAVQTTGTGTAISTATTNTETVVNASVVISGGTVSSLSGNTVNITGAKSSVTMTGGQVSSTTGNTIYASGVDSVIAISDGSVSSVSGNAVYAITSAANANITVDGNAKVSSVSGGTNIHAIYTLGTGSSVTIGANSQVWVLKKGSAISSAGTLTLNGGFIFAFGDDARGVITPNSTSSTLRFSVGSGSSVLVVAWNEGNDIYPQGTFPISHPKDNMDLDIRYNGNFTNFWWHNNPTLGGGIEYQNGTTHGFFSLPGVTIVRDYGLIYDVTSGHMYLNVTGSGIPGGSNYRIFPFSHRNAWTETPSEPNLLILNGLSWSTTAAVALSIYGGPVEIELTGGTINSFVSVNTLTDSFGIFSQYSIDIGGGGVLSAAGGSIGISADLNMVGGTIEAKGGTEALSSDLTALPLAYTYWTNTDTSNPEGEGTTYIGGAPSPFSDNPFTYDPANRYTKISAGSFAMIDDVTVSGTVGAALSSIAATIHIYGPTINAAGLGSADSWFGYMPQGVTAVAGYDSTSTISLTFDGTPLEGYVSPFYITVPGTALDGNSINVIFNPDAKFDIIGMYDLFIVDGTGGSVTGTPSGRYVPDTAISITATANAGYRFTGWDISGAVIGNGVKATTTFNMPANNVIVTATWAQNTTPSPKPNTPATISPEYAVFDIYAEGADHKDISVTLSPGSYAFVSITYGGYTLKAGSDYTVSGNDYTIKKEYLSTLSLGQQTFTFNVGGNDPVLIINVIDTTPTPSDNVDTHEAKGLAILNLICMVLSIVIGLIAVTVARRWDREKIWASKALRFVTLILAIVAVVVFFLTQGLNGRYVLSDEWSIVMVILTIAAFVLVWVSTKYGRNAE